MFGNTFISQLEQTGLIINNYRYNLETFLNQSQYRFFKFHSYSQCPFCSYEYYTLPQI